MLANVHHRPQPQTAQRNELVSVRLPAAALRGSYDIAETNRNNVNHWLNATDKSANAEASPEVRKTIRQRARYETRNNSYAKGIVQTKANDVVGRGPRLQMLTDDKAFNRELEEKLHTWLRAARIGSKLLQARSEIGISGEALAVGITNPALRHPVKLDITMIEIDRLTSPWEKALTDDHMHYDGIDFDAAGNPAVYHILTRHPGDDGFAAFDEFYRLPANRVIHLFKRERPGQKRGVSEIAPGLPLFAYLRRLTLATVDAAETAANFSAVLTQAEGEAIVNEDGETDDWPAMDVLDIERNAMMTLPYGMKMSQFRAEHPNATYAEFKRELISEAARCCGMPLGLALMNFSGYNYSSGRLDHQSYFREIRIDQHDMGLEACDPILSAFLQEASRIPGFLTSQFLLKLMQLTPGGYYEMLPHEWMWDGTEHVDPQKEANAQKIRLISGTTTKAHEFAMQGKDYEQEMRQQGREDELKDEIELRRLARKKELMEELGLSVADLPGAPATTPEASPDPDEDPDDDEEEDNRD